MGGVATGGGGSLFDTIVGGISSLGNAAASGINAWAGIKQRKLSMQLQQSQVQAEIAKFKASTAATQAAARPTPVSALNPSSFSLSSIPSWMIAAGALAAFFAIRGAVK